jgi:glycosyltransferase involved in cell wall biosynthesis
VFFTLCSMEPVKGIPDLLKAIRLLIDRLPEGERGGIAFRLGGDGPNRREYQDECHGLGLDPWVTWLGFLPRAQARREFQECDAYVLASRYESFGVVLAEALASGRPLIATRCGGPETIVTPENGLLVPVGRPDELAGALHAMLREAGRYDPRVLREDFMRRFSRPAVVERIEEIYRRAIAGQGQTR